MRRIRADTSGLKARFGSMRRLGPLGRMAALRSDIGGRMAEFLSSAPMDTNRYVRGWAQAAQQIGAEGIVVPPLKKSRYLERYVEAFEYRIAVIASRLREQERLLRDGRPNRKGVRKPVAPASRARIEKSIESLKNRIARQRQRLRDLLAHDHALVIGAGPIYDRGGGDSFIALHASWTKPTITLKVYGGVGKLSNVGHTTTARLTNKEPHALLVHQRIRIRAARMKAWAERAKAKYLRAVDKNAAPVWIAELRDRSDYATLISSLAAEDVSNLQRFTGAIGP